MDDQELTQLLKRFVAAHEALAAAMDAISDSVGQMADILADHAANDEDSE